MNLALSLIAVLVLIALLVADWRQTLVIARNPHRLRERNPILGEHPPVWWVHVYFAAAVLIVLAMAYGLRHEPAWSAWLAGIAAVMQAVPVVHNHRSGIRP